MSDNKELLPCPFCGCNDMKTNVSTFGFEYIECRECGADGPLEDHSTSAEDYWNRRAAQPVVLSDDLRDKVRDAIAAALGEAMDCTRVWSAWSYGTMGPNDFSVVANDDDRLEEIVDAALNAILAAKEQA
jgi:Lar family restriction alleviation protein